MEKLMFDYIIKLLQTNYEEHGEIGASWMRGLILGVLIGMFLIAGGIILRMNSQQSSEELSRDCFIFGIPLFIICLILLTIWKRHSENRQSN